MKEPNSIEVIEINLDTDVLLVNIPIGQMPIHIAEKYVDKMKTELQYTKHGKFNKLQKVFTVSRTDGTIEFKILRLK